MAKIPGKGKDVRFDGGIIMPSPPCFGGILPVPSAGATKRKHSSKYSRMANKRYPLLQFTSQ